MLNGKNHPYHLRNYARIKLLAPSKLMSGNSFEGLCMSLFDLFIEVATRLVSSYLFIGVATFYVPGQICGSSQLNWPWQAQPAQVWHATWLKEVRLSAAHRTSFWNPKSGSDRDESSGYSEFSERGISPFMKCPPHWELEPAKAVEGKESLTFSKRLPKIPSQTISDCMPRLRRLPHA